MGAPAEDFENFSWRKIGLLHVFGIVVAPYIFGLVVLFKEGYSKRAKLLTGIYTAIFLFVIIGGRNSGNDKEQVGSPKAATEQSVAGSNNPPTAKE